MTDARGALMLVLIFAALGFLLILAVAPGPNVSEASLPVDRPNRHIIHKHPEACKFFEPDNRDGWVTFFSKSLGQWLFCKPDPYSVDEEKAVRGVFIGAELIPAGVLAFFVITAFWAKASYWRRVVDRDGYER